MHKCQGIVNPHTIQYPKGMGSLIYFSDAFTPIMARVNFLWTVFKRYIRLTFKRRKRLTLISLDYSTQYLFDSSFLIVNYHFENALWYHFKNISKTVNQQVVLNLANIHSHTIELVVHGYSQTEVYYISIAPQHSLKTTGFHVVINNIKPHKVFKGFSKSPSVHLRKPTVVKNKIAINHSPYTQSDFL